MSITRPGFLSPGHVHALGSIAAGRRISIAATSVRVPYRIRGISIQSRRRSTKRSTRFDWPIYMRLSMLRRTKFENRKISLCRRRTNYPDLIQSISKRCRRALQQHRQRKGQSPHHRDSAPRAARKPRNDDLRRRYSQTRRISLRQDHILERCIIPFRGHQCGGEQIVQPQLLVGPQSRLRHRRPARDPKDQSRNRADDDEHQRWLKRIRTTHNQDRHKQQRNPRTHDSTNPAELQTTPKTPSPPGAG